jgi:two-component system, OmpR family, sensor kinase
LGYRPFSFKKYGSKACRVGFESCTMKIAVWHRLSVRLWLAVLLAVLVMALLMGWLLRYQADRIRAERGSEIPAREMTIRSMNGQVIGQALIKPVRVPGRGIEFQMTLPPGLQGGEQISMGMPQRNRGAEGALAEGMSPAQSMRSYFSRLWNPASPEGASSRFVLILIFFSLAVVIGSYPVVRRLTQRLEALQRGVEQLGAGDLKARVPQEGHDEVAFLAQRFNRAADQVQALVQAQQSLLANASHELRSPLARIRMGLELMQSAPSEALKTELSRNMAELDALIDEILLASRLQTQACGALQAVREPVDMLGLAAEEGARVGVALNWQAAGEGSAQSALSAPRHTEIAGDARLLRRLLRNLLENAQRYGGQAVSLHMAAQAGVLRIEVADQGPGVPPSEREKIFEPFYRSSTASESSGGVGLGLALVRSIAQQHGGSVQCTAREDGSSGARFVVCLPMFVAAGQ